MKTPKSEAELNEIINGTKSKFLSVCTSIENQLEIVMADYFSKGDFDDYKLFSKLFYGGDAELTFSQKIKIFEKFLKEVYPEYLKSNTDLINSLNRVRKMRNKFAHYINPGKDVLSKYVGKSIFPLIYIEDGILKDEEFPFKDIVERFHDFSEILKETTKIMDQCKKTYQSKQKDSET